MFFPCILIFEKQNTYSLALIGVLLVDAMHSPLRYHRREAGNKIEGSSRCMDLEALEVLNRPNPKSQEVKEPDMFHFPID